MGQNAKELVFRVFIGANVVAMAGTKVQTGHHDYEKQASNTPENDSNYHWIVCWGACGHFAWLLYNELCLFL